MIRRQLFAIAVLIVLALSVYVSRGQGTTQQQRAQTPSFDSSTWYPVTRVVDGDTIMVAIDNTVVSVRLIGLDTPETVDPRRPVECFGTEASEAIQTILGTGYVRLEADPSQGRVDSYGRLLAYVYAPLSSRQEGLLVNEYMIREGFGHEYTFSVPYRYQTEFKDAEHEARTNEKGLWALDACQDA